MYTAVAVNVFTALFIIFLILKSIFVFKASGFSTWLLSAMAFGCISYTIGITLWYGGVKDI